MFTICLLFQMRLQRKNECNEREKVARRIMAITDVAFFILWRNGIYHRMNALRQSILCSVSNRWMLIWPYRSLFYYILLLSSLYLTLSVPFLNGARHCVLIAKLNWHTDIYHLHFIYVWWRINCIDRTNKIASEYSSRQNYFH